MRGGAVVAQQEEDRVVRLLHADHRCCGQRRKRRQVERVAVGVETHHAEAVEGIDGIGGLQAGAALGGVTPVARLVYPRCDQAGGQAAFGRTFADTVAVEVGTIEPQSQPIPDERARREVGGAGFEQVIAGAAEEGIAAAATGEGVVAATTGERVVVGRAGERDAGGIAGVADRPARDTARLHEVDVVPGASEHGAAIIDRGGGSRPVAAQRRLHGGSGRDHQCIGAIAEVGDGVATGIHVETVRAGPASERVGTCAAGERVGPGCPGQAVVGAAAGEGVVAAAADKVFDIDQRVGAEAGSHRLGGAQGEAHVEVRRRAGVAGHVATEATVEAVVAAAADQGVVAQAADEAVVARAAAVEDVIAVVAGDRVGQRITSAVEVCAAGEDEVLEVGPECVADRGAHGVGARRYPLGHAVAGVVDHVGVVAGTAGHDVGTGAAVEDVVAAVAGEAVGERVAGAVDVGAAGEFQVFQVGANDVADRRADGVGTLVGQFRDQVAGAVDDVDIVADTAAQGVCARAAIERVGPGVADQDVGLRIAGEGVVAGAAGEVLDGDEAVAAAEAIGYAHRIARGIEGDRQVAAAGAVVGGVDAGTAVEGIVAGAPDQGIVSGLAVDRIVAPAPVEHVVETVAVDGVVAVAGNDPLDVAQGLHAEPAGIDGGVVAGLNQQHDQVARDRAVVGRVAACTTNEGVVADAGDEPVIAAVAGEGIRTRAAGEGVVEFRAGKAHAGGAACVREHPAVGAGDRREVGAEADGIDLGTACVAAGGSGRPVGAERGGGGGACAHAQHVRGTRAAREIGDAVAARIDDEGVGTAATGEGVVARSAVEGVVPAIALQRVGEFIAGAGEPGGAGEHEVFDVGGERVADGRAHRVGAFTGQLDGLVTGVIDEVEVIADATTQGVGAGAAIEGVVALPAFEQVDGRIAGEDVVAATPSQVGDAFEGVVAQPVAHGLRA